MAATQFGMKVSFHHDVQLKARYCCRRRFAIFIPNNCETVQHIKDFLAQKFCSNVKDRLEIMVDLIYVLCDEDSIDVIRYYSAKDSVFQCQLNPHPKICLSSSDCSCTTTATTSTSAYVSVNGICSPIDEVDSFNTPINTVSTIPQAISGRKILSPKRRLKPNHYQVQIEVDEDQEESDAPFPSTIHGAPKKAPQPQPQNDVGRTPETVDQARKTSSAKRRERLMRSVSKRLRLTPKVTPIDVDKTQNKENETESIEPNDDTTREANTSRTENSGDPTTDLDSSLELLATVDTTVEFLRPEAKFPRRSLRSNRGNKSSSMSYFPGFHFKSEILRNKSKTEDTAPMPIHDSDPDPVDYSTLADVSGIDEINSQDVIAFKVWELGDCGEPGLSEYKEAKIVDKTDDGRLVLEYSKGGPTADESGVNIDGYMADDTFGCSTTMDFQRLVSLKVLPLQ